MASAASGNVKKTQAAGKKTASIVNLTKGMKRA